MRIVQHRRTDQQLLRHLHSNDAAHREAAEEAICALVPGDVRDPRPWLFRVARNSSIDGIRATARADHADPEAADAGADFPGVEDRGLLNEDLAGIAAAVQQLPASRCEALLDDLDGPLREGAARREVTLATENRGRYRARQHAASWELA